MTAPGLDPIDPRSFLATPCATRTPEQQQQVAHPASQFVQRTPSGIEMLILTALAVRLVREHGEPARAEAA